MYCLVELVRAAGTVRASNGLTPRIVRRGWRVLRWRLSHLDRAEARMAISCIDPGVWSRPRGGEGRPVHERLLRWRRGREGIWRPPQSVARGEVICGIPGNP